MFYLHCEKNAVDLTLFDVFWVGRYLKMALFCSFNNSKPEDAFIIRWNILPINEFKNLSKSVSYGLEFLALFQHCSFTLKKMFAIIKKRLWQHKNIIIQKSSSFQKAVMCFCRIFIASDCSVKQDKQNCFYQRAYLQSLICFF
jgi:hypothetical protein